jgi:hypothetical protein
MCRSLSSGATARELQRGELRRVAEIDGSGPIGLQQCEHSQRLVFDVTERPLPATVGEAQQIRRALALAMYVEAAFEERCASALQRRELRPFDLEADDVAPTDAKRAAATVPT